MNTTSFNSCNFILIIVNKVVHCNDQANNNSANTILSAFNSLNTKCI